MKILQMSTTAIARLTAAWGVFFAVVHGYWAAGGEFGMNGDPADTAPAQAYIGVISLVGLAGAGVAYGLGGPARGPAAHHRLTALARAGGVALLLGVAVGTLRWIVQGDVAEDGAAGVATTLYFLLGGMLFSVLARRSGPVRRRPTRASGSPRPRPRPRPSRP